MSGYPGRALAVIDGDTFHATLSARVRFLETVLRADQSLRVRLLGVDCPEKRDPGGAEATAYTRQWLQAHAHPEVVGAEGAPLWFDGETRDSFGRLLAVVSCGQDGRVLNHDLLTDAHATPYRALAHVAALQTLEGEGHRSAGRLLATINTNGAP